MFKPAAIIFALIFFSRPALPLLDYVVNYNYITKELCINKDSINNLCKGKCHLKKELAKASHSTSQGSGERKIKIFELDTLFIMDSPQFNPADVFVPMDWVGDRYVSGYTHTATTDFFHPPAIS